MASVEDIELGNYTKAVSIEDDNTPKEALAPEKTGENIDKSVFLPVSDHLPDARSTPHLTPTYPRRNAQTKMVPQKISPHLPLATYLRCPSRSGPC